MCRFHVCGELIVTVVKCTSVETAVKSGVMSLVIAGSLEIPVG